ncbi:MAG: hypothetical protein LUC23_04805 [Prevotellaceae bacterium]|nr:hypothetical protein [Prevotellaceae bacterium]
MRKGTIQRAYIKAAICGLVLLPACASCIDDTYVDAPAGEATTVNVGLTLRADNVSGNADGYVQGSTYENYIDLDGDTPDYRIYFFTNSASGGNDTYLATFKPLEMVNYYYSDYTEYRLYGEVNIPDVIDMGSFKIMVLANWGADNYNDEDFTTSTTIDNVCTATTATFNAFVDDDDDGDGNVNAVMPSADNRIPFYGIHAYSGYTFEPGKAVTLSEPVTLLRAMAKVEVTLETEDVTFSDVTIQHYNATGYCAPAGVYSEAYYGQGTSWSTDYLADVHLVGDANDHNEDGTPIDRGISLYDANGDGHTWVAYLPEYRNTDEDYPDDYAYIEVRVDGGDTYEIYFADYTLGVTDNDDVDSRYDIQRDNLYSFSVRVLDNYSLSVSVKGWTSGYENDYEFGTADEQDNG